MAKDKDTVVGMTMGWDYDKASGEKASEEMMGHLRALNEKQRRQFLAYLKAGRQLSNDEIAKAALGYNKAEVASAYNEVHLAKERADNAAAAKDRARQEKNQAAAEASAMAHARKMQSIFTSGGSGGLSGGFGQAAPPGGWMNMSKLSGLGGAGPGTRGATPGETAAIYKILGIPTPEQTRHAEAQAERELRTAQNRAQRMKERLAQQAQHERTARFERRSQFVSGAMMGTGLFAVGEGGKLLSTLGLGNTPIGSAYAGGAAGLGAGMSMGMAGGPLGVIAGGAIGAGAGAVVGGVTGVVKMAMDLLMEGVHKAMSVVEEGARQIIKLGMEYERTLIKFEVLTGSKAAGTKLYGGIEKMATQTPYTAGQISSNVEMLLGYGVKPDQALPAARRIGDIAAGDVQKYQRLALAFGQVTSQGRLMGAELRQFSEAGVGAADFAETYGKSVFQLKQDMEAGIVPASVMVKTIQRLTSEGGRFFEMNERVSKSVEGRWNALVGTAEMAGRRIGKALFERFDVAGKLNTGVGLLEGWIGTGGIDKMVDKIEKLGKNLYDAIVPTLDYAFDVVQQIVGTFGESGVTWNELSQVILGTFKAVLGITLTVADLMKTLFQDALTIAISLGKATGALDDQEVKELKMVRDRLSNSTLIDDIRGAMRSSELNPGKGFSGLVDNLFGGAKSGLTMTDRDFSNWQDRMLVFRRSKETGFGEGTEQFPLGSSINYGDSQQANEFLAQPHIRKYMEFIRGLKSKAQYDLHEKSKGAMAGLGGLGPATGMFFPKEMRGPVKDALATEGVTLKFSPEVSQLFEDLTKALREGISPMEKFNKSMANIATASYFPKGSELSANQAVAGGGILAGMGPALRPEDADRLRYEAFMKLRSSINISDLPLPASVGRDTQESIKIINEASRNDPTNMTQESILAVLVEAEKHQNQTMKDIAAVRAAFEKKGIVLKPEGVGDK